MPQDTNINRRVVLANRPSGNPDANTFRLEEAEVPKPGPGQMLLRTQWLSIDPYMRVRINEGDSYMPAVQIGEVMVGGTVSRVEASNHPDYKPGDLVHSYAGWQDFALSDGTDVILKLPADAEHPSQYLGGLGMPGFAAWYGLLEIGQPKSGETVVVAAATGAVGQIVGALAKQRGCRVVGVAGGPDKCSMAVEKLGFDACVDHYQDDMDKALAAACPKGIDVYFENVGGKVLMAVLPLLNVNARMPVCGMVSWYNMVDLPSGPDHTPELMSAVLMKRLLMHGFIIFDHYPTHHARFQQEMGEMLKQGSIHFHEDVISGLERAPTALIGLLRGDNIGKLAVHVAD